MKIETDNYKAEKEADNVVIIFKANELMDFNQQIFFMGGYLFPQSIYYDLKLDYVPLVGPFRNSTLKFLKRKRRTILEFLV